MRQGHDSGFRGLKKFSVVGGGGRESENSVCPRLLLQLLQFLQFRSVRLCQFTLEGRNVELDNWYYVIYTFLMITACVYPAYYFLLYVL